MGGSEVGAVRALVLASFFLIASPAAAQNIYCEGLIEARTGDVIAGFDLTRDGAIKSHLILWMPRMDVHDSSRSTFMRSPKLVLHFRERPDGDLVGPSSVNIAYTQYTVPGSTHGLTLAKVTVQAIAAPSGKQLSWQASELAKGEPELAKLLRETRPTRVTVNFLGPDKNMMATAQFDLTGQDDVRKLLPQAKAKAEREIANYRRLIAEGKKLDSCPAL